MIKFDPSKEKNLTFDVDVEGIDPKSLEYTLRLSDGNVDYGFKGINENGRVKFSIPPLNDVVNESMVDNLRQIKMEVHDKGNKYYLKPYEDDVKIKKEPKINASVNEEEEINEDHTPTVKTSVVSEEDNANYPPKPSKTTFDIESKTIEESSKESKKKKESKFGKFLEN